MRIFNCFVCSRPIYPSKGIMFIRNDAKEFRFCRSKCHKNFKMKRNPRKLKWTKSFRKAAGKEMVVDSSLTFNVRRNVPTRYSRELVSKTLTAMSRVEEIRRRRERRFYMERMKGNKAKAIAADRKLVEENQHMLPEYRRSLADRESIERETDDESMVEEVEEQEEAIKVPVLTSKEKKKRAQKADTMDLDD
ncbi:hypothetical protein BJ508DRAFT_410319 [Ascobolus immersus RN42]|uniref:Ribosome biogenesis protein RLP24 n=1 Tax=Ascobolus immersus RN42 TaxID=1160509 RepID=A0A3N4IP78_ASCIM|nr:hypothetical protein BJ508DRAFT_410319 [Ascobolus immersus RN42]